MSDETKPELMDNAELAAFMNTYRALNTVLVGMDDLPRFIRTLERQETLGPFMDPTGFMRPGVMDNLKIMLGVARKYLAVQTELKKVAPKPS